jgi:hypothetical protein
MATLHREYTTIEVDGKVQEIKFSVSFNKDQYNWATNERKKIGYQVSATPVTRVNKGSFTIEEFGAFTGFNDNLTEWERPSPKRLREAIAELEKRKETYINWFKNKLQNEYIQQTKVNATV